MCEVVVGDFAFVRVGDWGRVVWVGLAVVVCCWGLIGVGGRYVGGCSW